ncbi:hypothetical protein Tco_1335065 [Tanacetum coccineum]
MQGRDHGPNPAWNLNPSMKLWKSPDEEGTSEDVVESPYMGTIRSKGITQLLLLGSLDIIQVMNCQKQCSDKLYLSSGPSTLILNNNKIPTLKEFKLIFSDVKLTQESFPVEQVEPKNRTLEDLLRWGRN